VNKSSRQGRGGEGRALVVDSSGSSLEGHPVPGRHQHSNAILTLQALPYSESGQSTATVMASPSQHTERVHPPAAVRPSHWA